MSDMKFVTGRKGSRSKVRTRLSFDLVFCNPVIHVWEDEYDTKEKRQTTKITHTFYPDAKFMEHMKEVIAKWEGYQTFAQQNHR